MLVFIITATFVYLLKLLVDYVRGKGGTVHVSTVKGMMFGFDVGEEIVVYENQTTKERTEVREVGIEIAFFFVSMLLAWQEKLEEENEDDVY